MHVQRFLSHHVDVPADQFRRQTDVLTASANCQRELIVADQNQHFPQHRTENHVLHLGRLQSIRDQHLQAVIPANDINSFAVELFNNAANTSTANTDAGTDAVN